MADLDASLAPQIAAACNENAGDIAEALGRALDAEVVAKPGAPADPAEGIPGGGGLMVLLTFGDKALVATLPADSGLLPDWVKAPDPTGDSKLSTLAQELSMLVVPDELMADDFRAAWVDDLAAAIDRGQPHADALALPLEIAAGEQLGALRLLWPLAAGGEVFASTVASADAATQSDAADNKTPEPEADEPGKDEPRNPTKARVLRGFPPPTDYRDLPPNTVSMLQVSVPVSATLARKNLSINDIVELGPGSIITFDKSCDALLEICVADELVAEGEAVKVGERFGVRLRQMIMPSERFRTLLPPDDSKTA
ncbi:MAG: FliM/FliN family flagellar motor switch protein [Planctomycetota bacterium]